MVKDVFELETCEFLDAFEELPEGDHEDNGAGEGDHEVAERGHFS